MKKTLIYIVIIFVVLVIGLFSSAEIFEDKIGNAFKESVNETITADFQFESFDLSMVRSFPYASIRFHDLSVLDTSSDTLLFADRALFKLDLFSIFQSKIQLKAAHVENGFINILIDKKGNRNFEIATTDTSSDQSKDFGISEAIIKNMKIHIVNELAKSNADLLAEDLILDLNIKDVITSNILGTLKSQKIAIANNTYLENKLLSINSGLAYNSKINELKIQNGEIGVEGILFLTNGHILFNGDHEQYDLVINNTNGSLEEIFKLLPKNQAEDFKKISSRGDFNLTVFYKGKQSKYSNPVMQADLAFDRGRLVVPQLDIPLKAVSFSAKYTDKSKKGLVDASIQINGFKASMDGERIIGKFTYNNFKNPSINLNSQGKMPIQTVLNVLGIDAKETEGNIDFKALEINGKLSDLSNPMNQSQTVSKADVVLDNISFNLEGKEILLRDGRLTGHSDYFELNNLEVRTAKSVFEFDGYLKRLIPFLFAEFQRPDLQFDLDVLSATCDVEEILDMFNALGNTESDESLEENTSNYFASMNGDIDVSISKFNHKKIKGSDFSGHLSFSNNNVLVNGSCKGMDGRFELEAILNRNKQKDNIEAKISCQEVDVRKFFKQTENFGHSTLSAENLKGELKAHLLIYADWNVEGAFNQRGLKTYGSAQIKNGELIDFKLMENFSSYIKSEDLQHIKFGSLDNYFKIENQVIKIPAMFVQSNAANLTFSGEHAFNNAIDYNIKVNAGQVLTNKLRKHDPALRPIPARKRGFFNLYYAVNGTLDEPNYKTAKRQVKSDIERSELLKSEINSNLRQAFRGLSNFNINVAPVDMLDDTSGSVEGSSADNQ